MDRYHVTYGAIRTTVTVDTIVSEYLALHLGEQPNNPGARAAVRIWLQERVDRISEPPANLSQWLLGEALEALAATNLKDAHYKWQTDTIISKFW